MGMFSLTINSKTPILNWEKTSRKTLKFLQNSFAKPTVCKHLYQPQRDIVEISQPLKPIIELTPAQVAKEMNKLNIGKLRRLDTKTYSGETLEGKPETIKKLSELGFETIVDFRAGACDCYKKDCEKFGLKYFNFPLSHAKTFSTNTEINDKFVSDLRNFFDICDKSNAYLACQWGIDRTNVGIILNYLLNPTEHLTPEVIAWGGESAKSIINRNKKSAENVLKQLSPEQMETLKLEPDCRETLKRRSIKLINKNKNQSMY